MNEPRIFDAIMFPSAYNQGYAACGCDEPSCPYGDTATDTDAFEGDKSYCWHQGYWDAYYDSRESGAV